MTRIRVGSTDDIFSPSGAVATALAANAASFARCWGPIDWSDRVAAADIRPDPSVARMLWATSNVENEAFYVRISLRHSGMDRLPAIEEFLAIWLAEESEHARALAELGRRYGSGETGRIRPVGHARRRPFSTAALRLTGCYTRGTLAAYLTFGALQEHAAIVTYRGLADLVPEAVVRDVLGQVIRQEARHMRFYLKGAAIVLDRSPTAQRYTRAVLRRYWRPPGVTLLGMAQWSEIFAPLLADPRFRTSLCQVEDVLTRLPGMAELTIVRDFLAPLAPTTLRGEARRAHVLV